MPHLPLNVDQVQYIIDHSILRYGVPGAVLSCDVSFDAKVNILKGMPKHGNDYYYIYHEKDPHIQAILVRTKDGQWLEGKPFTKYVVKSQQEVHEESEKAVVEKAVAMSKKVYGKSAGSSIFWESKDNKKLIAHQIMPEVSGIRLIDYFEVKEEGVYPATSFLRKEDEMYDFSSDKKSKIWRLRAVVAVLEALKDVHARGVVHANVTLKNIIYDDETGVAHFVGFDDAVLEGESVKMSSAANLLPPDDIDVRAAAYGGEEVTPRKAWDVHAAYAVIRQLLSGIGLSKKSEIAEEREIADYLEKMRILTAWKEKERLEKDPSFKQPTAAEAAEFFGAALKKIDATAYDKQAAAIQKQRELQTKEPVRHNFEKLYIATNLAEQKLAADTKRLQEKIDHEKGKDPEKGEKKDEKKIEELQDKIKVFDGIRGTLQTQMQKIDEAIHKPTSDNSLTHDNFKKIYQNVRAPFVSEDSREALGEHRNTFLKIFSFVTRPWSMFVGVIRGVLTKNWTTFEGGFAATDSLSAYVSAASDIAAVKPENP